MPVSLDYNTSKGAVGAAVVGAGLGGFKYREKVVGLIFTNAGAPTSGGSGTHKDYAPKGSLLQDTTNGTLYQNTGTLASPTWTLFSLASGAGAFTGTFDGAVGSVTPAAGIFTDLDGELGANTPAAAAVTTLTASGIVTLGSVGTGLTAVGTNRATSLALTKQINNIGTAGSGTGVTLPAAEVGNAIIVFNNGANAIKVYGAGSDTIDGVAAATGVALTNAKRAVFICVAAATYISAQLGVVSA